MVSLEEGLGPAEVPGARGTDLVGPIEPGLANGTVNGLSRKLEPRKLEVLDAMGGGSVLSEDCERDLLVAWMGLGWSLVRVVVLLELDGWRVGTREVALCSLSRSSLSAPLLMSNSLLLSIPGELVEDREGIWIGVLKGRSEGDRAGDLVGDRAGDLTGPGLEGDSPGEPMLTSSLGDTTGETIGEFKLVRVGGASVSTGELCLPFTGELRPTSSRLS